MIEDKTKHRIQHFVINAVFILLSICCVLPLLLILAASFTSERSLAINGYRFIPEELSFTAFTYIFKSPKQILTSYGVTIFVTVVGTFFSVIFTGMLAYTIARKDFKLSRILSFLVFFTLLFSGGMVPSYIMISKYYHLKDTVWAMMLPYIIMPWHVFLMKGFFADIPVSLVEAAKIDGSSEVNTFFKIIIPISKPAFATIGLFCAFTYWNDWWLSMLYIDNPDLTSLQYYLYRIMNNIQFLSSSIQAGNIGIDVGNLPSETARMALCLVAAGPMLIIFPFFPEILCEGTYRGSSKRIDLL